MLRCSDPLDSNIRHCHCLSFLLCSCQQVAKYLCTVQVLLLSVLPGQLLTSSVAASPGNPILPEVMI